MVAGRKDPNRALILARCVTTVGRAVHKCGGGEGDTHRAGRARMELTPEAKYDVGSYPYA